VGEAAAPFREEVRQAPDGGWYTQQQFFAWFDGLCEWAEAAPDSAEDPVRAPFAPRIYSHNEARKMLAVAGHLGVDSYYVPVADHLFMNTTWTRSSFRVAPVTLHMSIKPPSRASLLVAVPTSSLSAWSSSPGRGHLLWPLIGGHPMTLMASIAALAAPPHVPRVTHELRYPAMAPRVRYLEGNAFFERYMECEWRPSDGIAAAAGLRALVPSWMLQATQLPVVVTFGMYATDRVGAPRWHAHSVACESVRMRDITAGPQMGFYMLTRRGAGDIVDVLDGAGSEHRFRPQSAAFAKACDRGESAAHSFLFVTREAGGLVRLWDGAAGRLGGLRNANDPRGMSTDQPNAAIAWQTDAVDFSEDFVLRACRTIPPVSNESSVEEMRKAEVVWRYGREYWEAELRRSRHRADSARVMRAAAAGPRPPPPPPPPAAVVCLVRRPSTSTGDDVREVLYYVLPSSGFELCPQSKASACAVLAHRAYEEGQLVL
jgi:hypothetical protein